jgi:hypothetical protein
MYLKHVYIKPDSKLVERFRDGFVGRFRDEVCCITEHYAQLIRGKIELRDTAAVQFVFTDSIESAPETYGLHNCLWPFPFKKYAQASNPDKKQLIFDALDRAMNWLSQREGWPRQPILDAKSEMLRSSLRYEGVSKRSWLDPSRFYRCKIHYDFEIDRVYFTAILLDARSKNEVARKPIGDVKAGIQALDCAGSATWISANEFQIKSAPHVFARHEWVVNFSDIIKVNSGS